MIYFISLDLATYVGWQLTTSPQHSTIQWVPLYGITDNVIKRLRESNLSIFTSPKLFFHALIRFKLIPLLVSLYCTSVCLLVCFSFYLSFGLSVLSLILFVYISIWMHFCLSLFALIVVFYSVSVFLFFCLLLWVNFSHKITNRSF